MDVVVDDEHSSMPTAVARLRSNIARKLYGVQNAEDRPNIAGISQQRG